MSGRPVSARVADLGVTLLLGSAEGCVFQGWQRLDLSP